MIMRIFKLGDRVTHMDNPMMRGEVRGISGPHGCSVLWDHIRALSIEDNGKLLPVPFGMGTRVDCESVLLLLPDSGTVIADIGDARLIRWDCGKTIWYSLDDIQKRAIRAVVEGKEGWPVVGDTYWTVSVSVTPTVEDFEFSDYSFDKKYRESGNFYRTRKDAEAAAERVRKALKGE